jgi:hypothetical protein
MMTGRLSKRHWDSRQDFDAIRDILNPSDAAKMRRYPVSTKLNNSQNQGAESAAPITLDTPIQARLFSLQLLLNTPAGTLRCRRIGG